MRLFLLGIAAFLLACGGDSTAPSTSNRIVYHVQADSIRYEYWVQPDSFSFYRERWLRPYVADATVTLVEDTVNVFLVSGTLAGYFLVCDIYDLTGATPEDCEGIESETLLAFLENVIARGEWRRGTADTLIVDGPRLGWLRSGGEFNVVWRRSNEWLWLSASLIEPQRYLSLYIPWRR